jgi:predicted short-subunit dehydrogenase-like oxidoreductase (DUF2520 family)
VSTGESMPVVFVMGAGVVGTTLAARLMGAGVPIAGLHGRQPERSAGAGAAAADSAASVPTSSGEIPPALSESEVVIIAVRDDRIPDVAARLVREQRLRKDQVLLHTSGAIAAAQALAAARPHVRAVGTLHPLLSFAAAAPGAIQDLASVAFCVEGDDAARAVATRLVRLLGGRALLLDGESLPLYHAGAVVASNYVVALVDVARGLLVAAGVPAAQALPALLPLLSSVVQNLSQVGLPGALTGPIERGDVSSVEQHVRILEARAPAVLDLYRMVGHHVLRLARKKSPLEPATVARLQDLLRARAAASGTNGDPISDPSAQAAADASMPDSHRSKKKR